MNTCKNCNLEIKKTNTFCGSSCSAIYNNKNRSARTEESRKKTSVSMKKFASSNDIFGGKAGIAKGIKTRKSEAYRKKISKILRESPNRVRLWTKEQLVYINRESVHRSRAKKKGLLPESADVAKMRSFYLNTPDGYEVDHIKPFAVGGFHHQDNLQYLTVEANREKGQKYSQSAHR